MKPFAILLLNLLCLLPAFSQAQEGDIDAKMQKMAAQLAERIRATGKNRVGVADFNDLQSNVPELGKFLAENLQGELINNQLRVINRQRIEQLLIENKLTAQKLLDPTNSLTLGKAAGMEVIVTGTITPLDERTIVLNVLALDIQGAIAIASAKTSIARTPSLNILLNQVVRRESKPGPEPSPPNNTDYEEEMPKDRCEVGGWGYGKICFRNGFTQPILLYKVRHTNDSNASIPEMNILIASGTEGCSTILPTFNDQFRELIFYFRTTDSATKEGFATMTVDKCKARHVTLTPSNFLLKAKTDR